MAFCAAIATAAVLGACGGGVPGDAVAQVGSANITKAAFDHWLLVANNATQASTGTKAPPVPDPPNYTNCIAAERKIPAEAGASAAQLKTVCSQNYQSLVTEVMSFLIQAVWIQGEAVDRHVSVTAKQVNKGYEAERLVSTPPLKTAAELRAFLAASGETIADLEWRTRLSLLANAISLKVQKGAAKVTSAAIAAYYKKNIASLTTPQTRSVHLVETSTSASAAKVKSLLAGGASYATVAPKYSIDPTTKTTGGAETVRPGQLTTQISAAIFAAKPGVLTGPVTTAFGYYVFTVDSVTPARVPTLKQETATIRSTIASSQEAAASSKLQADFTVKWTARTTCATGFIVSSCKNAPKTSTSSSSGASTGATAATG